MAALQREGAGVRSDSKISVTFAFSGEKLQNARTRFPRGSFIPVSDPLITSLMWIITALANFVTFQKEALSVPGGNGREGNRFVSSTDPFNYFLGKAWSALIYCDLSPINVHGFLELTTDSEFSRSHIKLL